MTYLFVILLILYGVYSFDICHKKDRKDRFYHLLLIVLILISGLGYRLGGDCIGYMLEYPQYNLEDGFGWDALNAYTSRQPGWVFLCKICRSISYEFWIFKMLLSILYNSMVFYGLKRLTTHRYSAILFYFILIYFDTNFQILRQALAMGLFLVAVPFYIKKKWIIYYSLIVAAIFFHEAAVICLPFPILRYIHINKRSIIIFACIFISIIVFIGPILKSILTAYIPEVFYDKLLYYAQEIDLESGFSFYINVLLSFIIPIVYVYLRRNNFKEDIIGKGTIIYGLLYTINLYFPIFYRFGYFYIFFFYLLYIDLLYDISKYGLMFWKRRIHNIKLKHTVWSNGKFITYVFLISCFLIIKSRFYFTPYGDTGMPTWVQYYPYTSIIFNDTDKKREEFINRL